MAPEQMIEAAGGVLWRPAVGGAGIEVALVHRPKYDDWSIPKGKLNSNEHPVLGAVREVREETGITGIPGRPLGAIEYLKEGSPKRVRYWAMRVASGAFSANREVDQMMWLPPREAQLHLSPDRDRDILEGVGRADVESWPCLLVRHASAGERSSWSGDDRERPLDALGLQQSEALVPLLFAYRVKRVLSADVVRCLQTIGPFASAAQLPVESEPLMSETGYGQHPDLALRRLTEVIADAVPLVVSSQGQALPGLISAFCSAVGAKGPVDAAVEKGAMFVLHLADGDDLRLVAWEKFDPVL